MNRKQFILFLFLHVLAGSKNSFSQGLHDKLNQKPTISFTFDDGITQDLAVFKFEEWNQMILTSLEKANLKAVFFVTGSNKLAYKGRFLLKNWNNKGHCIANHSFSHPNFNSEQNSVHFFEEELLKTDSIISKYNNYIKLFRFPYLKEGRDELKADSIRDVLIKYNYSNGYVTIDDSDWYINSRLIKRIHKVGVEKAEINKYKEFYLHHIIERAKYYEKLSFELNKRHISHTLILHHNLTSALFLDELIENFKEEGWEVIDADIAYKDNIYKNPPKPEYSGKI